MKSRNFYIPSLILLFGAAAPTPAIAQSASTYAFNFLKEVGCQLIPGPACDVLDSDNAINLLRANQFMFVNKFCGTGYIEAAKQMVETETALDNGRCREILIGIGAMR